MSSYIATELRKVIDVQSIVTVHYFEYAKNYVFEGERHDFWELVYMIRARRISPQATRRSCSLRASAIFTSPGNITISAPTISSQTPSSCLSAATARR